MIVFLDEKEKNEGLKFHQLEKEDWEGLFAAYNKALSRQPMLPENVDLNPKF